MENDDAATLQRSDWLSVLSRSNAEELQKLTADMLPGVRYEPLRAAHVGLVMVRGRAGGTGKVFNLGEMTVARASIRLADGTVGHGYVQGRNKRQAEIVAILDALMQSEPEHRHIAATVVEPLRRAAKARHAEMSRKAAATKVEFFTMVRGEDQP